MRAASPRRGSSCSASRTPRTFAPAVVACAFLVALGAWDRSTAAASETPAPAPPTSLERLYVSAEDGNQIVVVDPAVAAVVDHIPVGKRPRGLKVSPDGQRLYVALSG